MCKIKSVSSPCTLEPWARTPAERKQNTTALWDHPLTEALRRVSKIGCYFSGQWHGADWHQAIISTNIVTLLNGPM